MRISQCVTFLSIFLFSTASAITSDLITGDEIYKECIFAGADGGRVDLLSIPLDLNQSGGAGYCFESNCRSLARIAQPTARSLIYQQSVSRSHQCMESCIVIENSIKNPRSCSLSGCLDMTTNQCISTDTCGKIISFEIKGQPNLVLEDRTCRLPNGTCENKQAVSCYGLVIPPPPPEPCPSVNPRGLLARILSIALPNPDPCASVNTGAGAGFTVDRSADEAKKALEKIKRANIKTAVEGIVAAKKPAVVAPVQNKSARNNLFQLLFPPRNR